MDFGNGVENMIELKSTQSRKGSRFYLKKLCKVNVFEFCSPSWI